MQIIYYFFAGAFGSLVKDILADGKLMLPKVVDGALVLGFIGGMIVGGFVGWAVDGSMLTAAMAGYAGASIIPNLLMKYG